MKGIRGEVGEKIGKYGKVIDSRRTVVREGGPVPAKPKRADKPGTTVTIVLPLPPRILWPNGRGNHYAKAKSVKAHREQAFFEMREAMRRAKISGGWERAEAFDRFFWPDNGRRDRRNAEASLKSFYDGITDAGLWLDDNAEVLTHLPSTFAVDRVKPRVEVTVRKL